MAVRSRRRWLLAGLLFAPLALAQSTGSYSLAWHTLDAGGELVMVGGDYQLSSTIGQPDANPLGPMTGGNWELDGGFWPGVRPPPGIGGDPLFGDGFE